VREIHQVAPAKHNLFNKLIQSHEQQPLQAVGTKATSPRSIFAKQLALSNAAAKGKSYRVPNMTANKRLQYQIDLSNAEGEATIRSLADTEHVTTQLKREIHVITSNEQMRFKKEFSLRLIIF
jgi:hypothetical protein